MARPDHIGTPAETAHSIDRMAKFQPTWTEEQKAAIREAHSRHGMSGDAIHEACNTGTLPGIGARLEPFPIALATVRGYITAYRREQRLMDEAAADPAAILHKEAQALALAFQRMRQRMTRDQSTLTPEQVTALAKAGRELHGLLKGLDPKPPRNGAERGIETPQTGSAGAPHAGASEREPDFLDALANGSSKRRT